MRIAHHLMTWHGWLKKNKLPVDLPAILAEVKAAGYDGVEMGGDGKALGPAATVRQQLADAGLGIAAWSSGVTANPWAANTESYRRELDFAAELGVGTIVVCGGFLDGRRTTYEADYRLFAENLGAAQRWGERNRQTLAFHPHKGCIVETLGEVDRLVRYLPGLRLCVDTGHLLAVGEDPLLCLDAHAARVAALHLKDFDKAANRFTELGRGQVDLAAVLAWAARNRFSGPVIVERDDPPMPAVESARLSREHLGVLLAAAAAS
jgi:inosose dehydratase